jgi:hypothetical protein
MIRDRIRNFLNLAADNIHRMNGEPTMMACPVPMAVLPSNVAPFPTDKVTTRTGTEKTGQVLPFIRK